MGETVSTPEKEQQQPTFRHVGSVFSEDIYRQGNRPAPTTTTTTKDSTQTAPSLLKQQWRNCKEPPTTTTKFPISSASLSVSGEHPGPDDGYRWRKYGRKSVKGSAYPRSYYKCTSTGCNVKKQVETIVEDGKYSIHTTYKGEHIHEPPQITRLNAKDQLSFKNSVLSEFLGQTHIKTEEKYPLRGESASISLISKSLDDTTSTPKTTVHPVPLPSIAPPIMEESPRKKNSSPRLVVETSANIDYLDDGYNWRKYGQKNVKGSPHPRSYYKCTEKDCPVKKQVEQRGDKMVNSYEGTHNHLAPGLDTSRGSRKRRRRKQQQQQQQFLISNRHDLPAHYLPTTSNDGNQGNMNILPFSSTHIGMNFESLKDRIDNQTFRGIQDRGTK